MTDHPMAETGLQQVGEGRAIQARSTASETAWSPPAWLDAWQYVNPVPVPVLEVDRAIMAVERALEPVPADAILAGVKRLLDAMNPPSQSAKRDDIAADLAAWWKRNHEIYVAALADLPEDLLKAGSLAALRSCRFMPKPADIRKPVEQELARRHAALLRLRTARQKALRARPTGPVKREPLTPEQEAMLARIRGKSITNPSTEDAA